MRDEKQNRIEAMLRAAAAKRREQSGGFFALHPADRRRLQHEVAAKYGRATPTGWAIWLKGRLPTLGWGFATACVLAAAGWLIWDKDQQLAETNPPMPEMPVASGTGENSGKANAITFNGTPVPPAALGIREEKQFASAPQPDRARAMGGAPRPAAADPGSQVKSTQPTSRSSGSVVSAPAPAASVISDEASEMARSPAARVIRGTATSQRQPVTIPERPQATFNDSPASTFYFASERADELKVLADFSLTPTADGSLQVVDDDGSVYTGRWQAAMAAGPAPDALKEKSLPVQSLQVRRAATVRAELPPQGRGMVLYSFTVSGTNRGMNAPVTFEGIVFTAQTNDSAVAHTNAFKRSPLHATDASVSGKLWLPGGREVRVDARPVAK